MKNYRYKCKMCKCKHNEGLHYGKGKNKTRCLYFDCPCRQFEVEDGSHNKGCGKIIYTSRGTPTYCGEAYFCKDYPKCEGKK